MSESLNLQLLTRMLERLPGVTFCSRMDPATGKAQWLYINPRAADLYDVTLEELRTDPNAGLTRIHPEDRPGVEAAIARCMQTASPMSYLGRIQRRDGTTRWVETHANIDRDEDGSLFWYGQSIDVTERKELEKSLAASEAARQSSEALYKQIIDALPVGVMVANQKHEFSIMNPTHQRWIGGLADAPDGDVTTATGVFMADGVTPLPMHDSGMGRCLRGEALEEEVVIRNPRIRSDVRLHVVWTPLRDEGGKVHSALGTAQDITMQRKLEMDLRARNEELADSESAKATLIERLRYSIDELSNPILEVWDDVLAMPIIGVVDSRRTADMVQRLLGEVARTQASFVIIDLTGVEIVDTKTADHLMKLMRKVEIVGARCVLTGIRPAVAETLVDIGVDFGRLTTLRNLKHGLREALRSARRERDGVRELEVDELIGNGAAGSDDAKTKARTARA
ncbi:MAG: PAS domain-containing protein [Minicystis sp.]